MPLKDPIKRRGYQKMNCARWRAKNAERSRAYQREYRRKWRENPENRAKDRAAQKAHYTRHPEKLKEQNRKGYLRDIATEAGRAKRRENNRRDRQTHKERCNSYHRAYNKRNAERVRQMWVVNAHNRRHAPGSFTMEQWQSRFDFYGKSCAYCGKNLEGRKCEIDHVIPIAKKGTNWPSNLVPACTSCNRRKSDNIWKPRLPWHPKLP